MAGRDPRLPNHAAFRIISLGLLLVSILFRQHIQAHLPEFGMARMALRFLH